MVLSGPIITLVFGAKWAPAAPTLSIIGLIGAYLAIEMVHQSYCLAARKIGALAIVAWLEVGLAAGAVIASVSQGLTGVAYGFAGSFLILWVVRFAIVSNLSGVGILQLSRQHLMPLAASVGMAGAVLYLTRQLPAQSNLAVLAIGGLIGVAIYAAASWLFMRDRVRLAQQYFLRS